jgi:hypothetical protein
MLGVLDATAVMVDVSATPPSPPSALNCSAARDRVPLVIISMRRCDHFLIMLGALLITSTAPYRRRC